MSFQDQYLDGEKIDDCFDYFDDDFPYEKRLKEDYLIQRNHFHSHAIRGLVLGTISGFCFYRIRRKNAFSQGLLFTTSLIASSSQFLKACSFRRQLLVVQKEYEEYQKEKKKNRF